MYDRLNQPTTEARKIGRPKGSKNRRPSVRRRPTTSELYSRLSKMEINEYIYLEGTIDEVKAYQRRCNLNDSRRPVEMHNKKFATGTYTAICTLDARKIIYLIRIQRIA